MANLAQTLTESKQGAEDKIRQLRELFADAPELGRKALENVLRELTSDASERRHRRWKARPSHRQPSG